jgi:hypothetical protein
VWEAASIPPQPFGRHGGGRHRVSTTMSRLTVHPRPPAAHQQIMVEEYVNKISHQSKAHGGYCINANGGSFCNGAARPLEDKVRVAHAYARLLKADPTASVRAVAREGKLSRGFASKVFAEIEEGRLMDPKQKVRRHGGQLGAGAKTISDEDGEILLACGKTPEMRSFW